MFKGTFPTTCPRNSKTCQVLDAVSPKFAQDLKSRALKDSYLLTAKFIYATCLTQRTPLVRATFGMVIVIRANIDSYLSCLIILATNEHFLTVSISILLTIIQNSACAITDFKMPTSENEEDAVLLFMFISIFRSWRWSKGSKWKYIAVDFSEIP